MMTFRASAQQQDAQAWFDRAWADAQRFPDLGEAGAGLAWRVEFLYVPPADELEALKAEVSGHPDHPQRAALEGYLRRLAGHTDTTHDVLWSRGIDAWRYNSSMPGGRFFDSVRTPDRNWDMGDSMLSLYDDPARAHPATTAEAIRRYMWPYVGMLLSGGLSMPAMADMSPGPVRVEGDRWSVVLTSRDGRLDVVCSGTWDASLSEGRVSELRVASNARSPDTVGQRWVASDWRESPELGVWIAGRVTVIKANGRVDEAVVFEGAVPEPAGGFDELTRMPDVGSEDVIRGEVRPRVVHNYATLTRLDLQADGTYQASNIPAPSGATWMYWRPVGWVIGAGVIAAVVFAARRRPRLVAA